MRRFLLLALLAPVAIIPGCKDKRSYDPDPIKVELPSGIKSAEEKSRRNLMITLTADNKVYAGTHELDIAYIDSLMRIEIDKLRENELDTVTVVIQADSASSYGMVFHILKAAKKNRAKVVTRVE